MYFRTVNNEVLIFTGFEVLKAVAMKCTLFGDVAPYSSVGVSGERTDSNFRIEE
jgi:hypothetical protein